MLENGDIEVLDTKNTQRVIGQDVWDQAFPGPVITVPGKITLCYAEGRVQEVYPVVYYLPPPHTHTQYFLHVKLTSSLLVVSLSNHFNQFI